MHVHGGLVPRALTRAMIAQRSMVPEDDAAIQRLFKFLKMVQPTIAEIKLAVCEFYAINPIEIEGRSRSAAIVFARHVICYFAYKYARASLNKIKPRVGYYDHTTVHYGIRKIEQWSVTRQLVRDDLDVLRLRICEKVLQRTKGNGQC
jgi:chromosomal replication initiator protein